MLFLKGRPFFACPSPTVFTDIVGSELTRFVLIGETGGGTMTAVEAEVTALLLPLLLLLEDDDDEEDEEDDDDADDADDDDDDDEVAFLRTAMFFTFSRASKKAFCTATAL